MPVAGSQARPRYPEIDIAKGLAILCVLLIHAALFNGAFVHAYVVDRAVPVLLVLFGAASELWWSRTLRNGAELACAGQFVRSRFVRLMPPVWAALGVWWGLRLLWSAAGGPHRTPAAGWLLPHALGYIPQVGTGWFVTLIVQLVLCFPLLHWLLERCGPVLSLLLTAAIHVSCQLYVFDVVDLMRFALHDSAPVRGFFIFYYAWIFAPGRLLLLLTGMLLARHGMRLSARVSLLSAAAWFLGCVLCERITDPVQRTAWLSLLDIPLTLLWLTAARGLIRVPGASALAWLGRESWGVYLGQLLVHTSARLFSYVVEAQPWAARCAYVGLLLAGGILWVWLGDGVRAIRRFGARSRAQPSDANVHCDKPQPTE